MTKCICELCRDGYPESDMIECYIGGRVCAKRFICKECKKNINMIDDNEEVDKNDN